MSVSHPNLPKKNTFFNSFIGSTLVWIILVFDPTKLRADDVLLFAATSLINGMSEISDSYSKKSGTRISGSYQSSGVLARQIERGGPAQVFISADRAWIDYLIAGGHLNEMDIGALAQNQLVLVAQRDAPMRDGLTVAQALAELLGPGPLVIGDPGHVPAGRYAKGALNHLKQWTTVARRTAFASNVRQALAFVERGAAPLGVVYASDAIASKRVKIVTLVPPNSHAPIVYWAGLLSGRKASPASRAFHAFLFSPKSITILARHGFRAVDD